MEHYLILMITGKLEIQIWNYCGVIFGTLLDDDYCVQPIINRLYHTDPIVLYLEHYLMMNVVLYLEHYLIKMMTGKPDTQML